MLTYDGKEMPILNIRVFEIIIDDDLVMWYIFYWFYVRNAHVRGVVRTPVNMYNGNLRSKS